MEAPIKIPPEVKNAAVDAGTEALGKYAKTEPTTPWGKFLRTMAKVGEVILPFFKYFKSNK